MWISDRPGKMPGGSLRYESHHLPPRQGHKSSSLLGRGGRLHATDYQTLKLSIVRLSQHRRIRACDSLWNAAMVLCPAELCTHYQAANTPTVRTLAFNSHLLSISDASWCTTLLIHAQYDQLILRQWRPSAFPLTPPTSHRLCLSSKSSRHYSDSVFENLVASTSGISTIEPRG
jgi:hypothetical protein